MSSRLSQRQHVRPATGVNLLRPSILAIAKLLVLPVVSAAPLHLWERSLNIRSDSHEHGKDPEDPNLWVYLGVAVALVLLGGAFAGLTIALMGQDETYLQVIATSGEGSEKRHAKRVLGLLKKGKHWVLVTLLLSNVITNETLPIVLDRSLGGGWPAVLSSTVLIVIFGEIVPQSVCVRYGLSIGAFMAPFVLMLMWIMFPVAWPTAKLLDWLLGEDHGTMYKKAGLKTLVQLHKTLGTTPGERLMEDEVTIINSVLDLKEKAVGDIMTPMGDVFTMSADTVLDEPMMDLILSQGYSRIPVYAPDDRHNFIGMLLVKILITYDPEDCLRVRDFALATLPETSPYTSCLDIINFFQEGKSHMVLVSDFPGQPRGALGVVTLEDVIEELIGEEIIDESDVFVDVHKAIRRLAPAPKTRFRHDDSHEHATTESDHEDHEEDEHAPLLESGELGEPITRKLSLPNGKSATFITRRKSSNASDSTHDTLKPIVVPNNPADLRQHLKHLGPSNAASRPRSTRFASVKIKPAVGTIPEGQVASTDRKKDAVVPSDQTSLVSIPVSADERSGLLSSGGRHASGGVAALSSYGAANSTSSPLVKDGGMTASEATRAAEDHTSVSDDKTAPRRSSSTEKLSPSAPSKLIVGQDGTTDSDHGNGDLWDANNRFQLGGTPRRLARSGSITETMVDSGGMQKIVLETTSSSEELSIRPSASAPAKLDELGAESEADGDADAEPSQRRDGEAAAKKPKKKKRSKKKKGGE